MSETKPNERLFDEFPPVSTADWMATIEKDLKGADFNKALMWKGYEGISLKPFYRKEDLDPIASQLNAAPGEFPYFRGTITGNDSWKITQEITDPDPKTANANAKSVLSRGADEVAFKTTPVPGGVLGVAPKDATDLQTMLEGIDAPVGIEGGALTAALFDLIPASIAAKLKGTLDYDPIADVAAGTRLYAGADKLLSEVETFVKGAQNKAPNMVPITIRASHYLEAGGSAVQELAFAIAEGAEYLAKLGPETEIGFEYSIGSTFFVEIAKCRAARLLWANVLTAYGVSEDKAFSKIRAKTALWNKTTFDPYVNMLRVTTEAMAAALGGCDTVTVTPFDVTYEVSDEFSERIARNVQIILRDEAYLNRVHDVAGGSYFVETLTDALAQEAWKLFQKIEAAGGMLKALEQGLIQDEIKSVRDARDTQIGQRRHLILGTNQYPNAKETMSDKVKPAKPTPTSLKVAGEGGVEVAPIVAYRGAERYEAIRLATEAYAAKSGKRPVVFLLTVGSVAMRKARAGFVSNFFGCAGFEIIEGEGYDNVEAGVVDAAKAKADMVILCSSDDEYGTLGAPFCTLVTQSLPNAVRVIAGYPKDLVDSLKEAGIQDFIHVRTNALDALKKYQEQFCK